MSKNKYILPMNGIWYVEYGGLTKETSHSWNVLPQRYAYDLEIRKNNLPYHDDYTDSKNYYSYLEDIICPCDGYVVDICNKYDDTKILKDRPVVCDVDEVKGNYIIIKHEHSEYSVLCHIKKDTFRVKIGDIVKCGEVLAKVGNSGNTQGPHIHFHVQDGLNSTSSNGIKIKFNCFYFKKNRLKKTKYISKTMYVINKKRD